VDTRQKILVIEDDPSLLELFEVILLDEGYDVKLCVFSNESLDAVRGFCPDLIILDIVMPGMSGLDILHQLESDGDTSAIPVVICTGIGIADRGMVYQLASNGYTIIDKPFELNGFTTIIRSML
jgi:DNA-binding response OmpR family regulator